MLRTTRILIPSIVISLTILSLAVVYNGGCLDARGGDGQSFRVIGRDSKCD